MPSTVFQRLEIPSECGLIPPLVASGFVHFHPGHVSSAVFAGLRSLPCGYALDDERPPPPVHSTHRKPSLQTRPPETAGHFAASVRLRCKRRGHLLIRRQDLPGALLVLAPGTAPAGAGWPSLGSGRWPSAARLRRVHSARTRHATAKRRVMPVAVRYVHKRGCGHFSPRSPPDGGGFGTKNVLSLHRFEGIPASPHVPSRAAMRRLALCATARFSGFASRISQCTLRNPAKRGLRFWCIWFIHQTIAPEIKGTGD